MGGCVGHNCRLGSGMIVFPARTIESDVVLFASKERRVIDRDIRYEDSDHHQLKNASLHRRLYPRGDESERIGGGILVTYNQWTSFAFIIHPISVKRDVSRKYPFLGHVLSERQIEFFSQFFPPVYLSEIEGITSAATGCQIKGWLIACPFTPRQMVELPEARSIVRSSRPDGWPNDSARRFWDWARSPLLLGTRASPSRTGWLSPLRRAIPTL